MSRGFTLIEVVVALVLLEIGILGVVGTLLLARRTLTQAELTTRAAAEAALVADSLATLGAPEAGTIAFPGGTVAWDPDAGGARALVVVTGVRGDTLVRLGSARPR